MSDLTSYPAPGGEMEPHRRRDYDSDGIDVATIAPTPWRQFDAWVREAVAMARGIPAFTEPTAASFATVDAAGMPNVRTVLVRFLDERGPGFVSSLHSTKAAEIAANPHVALSFTWPGAFRAIRFRGVAEAVGQDELLDYWRTRPYGSKIAACASLQSHPVESRAELERQFVLWAARHPDTGREDAVPMPEDFCGWRVRASEVEFWAGRRSRLHDRMVFARIGEGSLDDATSWTLTRRQP